MENKELQNKLAQLDLLQQEVERLKQERSKGGSPARRTILGVLLAALLTGTGIYAWDVTNSNFTSGSTITAAEMNANFDDLATKITSLESSVNSLSTSVNTNATNVATAQALPLSGTAKGLRIYNQTTYPNSQMVVTASELIVANASYQAKHLSSVNLTLDLTVSGANGLDSGSEAVSTWYHIYVIHNPTSNNTAGLFSTSSTAPTLPTGYSHYAYVGAVYNESWGNLIRLTQVGKRAHITAHVLPEPILNTWAALSLANAVPNTATIVRGGTAFSGNNQINVAPDIGLGVSVFGHYENPSGGTVYASIESSILVPQQISVFYTSASGFFVSGWEFE